MDLLRAIVNGNTNSLVFELPNVFPNPSLKAPDPILSITFSPWNCAFFMRSKQLGIHFLYGQINLRGQDQIFFARNSRSPEIWSQLK